MDKIKSYKQTFAVSLTATIILMLFITAYYTQVNPPRNFYPQEIPDYQGEDFSS
ncbi:MAG: hypothetical protein WC046_09735 [Candidatus Bathyarchaeia archaeon]